MNRLRVLSAAGIAVVTVSGAAYAHHSVLPGGRALPGLRVEGFELPDDVARDEGKLTAYLGRRVESALSQTIEVHAGKSSRKLMLRDVVSPPDTALIARAIRGLGREGTLAHRVAVAMRARHGGIDLPIVLRPRLDELEKVATSLKGDVDEPATDAKLDLASHGIVADREGHSLELDGAVVALESELARRSAAAVRWDVGATPGPLDPINLTVTSTPAKVLASTLKEIDISTVVGTFETHFGRGGDQAPRAINIEVASKKLDGLVLKPGELVSFNTIVGERSESNGFKMAWEIFKGEMRPGFGGGTCQVASTFHAAAFFGGFDILERLPHSRPSAYIPMGLDSTVVYPVVDLKLKNPHNFPVVVHTKIGANTLSIELLGKSKPASVVFGREVVETFPFVRKIDEQPWVKAGQAIKKQGGIRGYRVRRSRTLKYTDGTSKTETSYDFYPPTTEIYVVSPGTDPKDLPALPEDVVEMLAKKNGEPIPSPTATDAVACAGECAPPAKTPGTIEVKNAAGVHDPVGDQATPNKSVSIAH